MPQDNIPTNVNEIREELGLENVTFPTAAEIQQEMQEVQKDQQFLQEYEAMNNRFGDANPPAPSPIIAEVQALLDREKQSGE